MESEKPFSWKSVSKQRGRTRQRVVYWISKKFRKMGTLREEDKRHFEKDEISHIEYMDLIEKEHANTFTLRELMTGCGLDYDGKKDYANILSILGKERRDIEKLFKYFVHSEEYKKAKENNQSDDEIWEKFITASNSWNVYLVYRDADGRYKEIDLFSYAMQINNRLRAINTEIRHKKEGFRIIGKHLPTLIDHTAHPELDGYKQRLKLLVSKPSSCPLCSKDFEDENIMKNHIIEEHHADKQIDIIEK